MSIGVEDLTVPEQRDEFIERALGKLDSDLDSSTGSEADQEDISKQTEPGDDVDSAGDEAVTEESVDEEPAEKEASDRDWLDDDLKSQVAAMGIPEDQLGEFSSRDELERALRFLDMGAMAAGRAAAGQAGDQSEKTDEAAQQRQRDSQGRYKAQPKPEVSSSGYQVQLDPESYDEAVVKEFNNLRDHYESRLSSFEDRISQFEEADRNREAAALEQRFDLIVDTLGYPELFGESGQETPGQMANRKKLYEEHQVHLAGLKALGRSGRTDKACVTRAFTMTFADHISKKREKELVQKAKTQSARRTGTGPAKTREPQYDGPLENDPELLAKWKEIHEG